MIEIVYTIKIDGVKISDLTLEQQDHLVRRFNQTLNAAALPLKQEIISGAALRKNVIRSSGKLRNKQ